MLAFSLGGGARVGGYTPAAPPAGSAEVEGNKPVGVFAG